MTIREPTLPLEALAGLRPVKLLKDMSRPCTPICRTTVAKMAIAGHDMVMKRVMISELKAHLSEYVAAARRGETVIVCDRDTPVARLEPLAYEPTIREPTLPLEALAGLRPVKLLKDVDVQAVHAEMRDDRF